MIFLPNLLAHVPPVRVTRSLSLLRMDFGRWSTITVEHSAESALVLPFPLTPPHLHMAGQQLQGRNTYRETVSSLPCNPCYKIQSLTFIYLCCLCWVIFCGYCLILILIRIESVIKQRYLCCQIACNHILLPLTHAVICTAVGVEALGGGV